MLYLDDIIIFSSTVEEHLKRIEEVLQRLRKANLMLKPSKCHFFRKEVEFLGHIVSQEGIRTNPAKIKTFHEWPQPRRVKDVKAFLGLTGYYHRFIKDYGAIAKPLHQLTEKNTLFTGDDSKEDAFQTLKQRSAPILGYPSQDLTD